MNPKIAMITNRNTELTKKSGTHPQIAAAGMTSRGKYTLVTRFSLPTRLEPELLVALANSVQGTNPTNANTGYGTPPVGTLAILLNSNVKIAISASGWMSAHAAPSSAC